MSNEIPEERFITKRQLWERADAHYNAYQSLLQEVHTRIDNIDASAMRKLDDYFKKLLQENNKNVMDSNSQYQTIRKEMEKLNNDAATRMQQQLNAHISKIDKKIGELVTLLDDKTDKKISERLASISSGIREMTESVRQYKTDTDVQMNKFQLDFKGKVLNLNKQFEDIKKKFKLVSSGLS